MISASLFPFFYLLFRFHIWFSVSSRNPGFSYKEYQGQDRHYVRDHGDQIRRNYVVGSEKGFQTVAETEQQTGLKGSLRSKLTKDHSRDRDKALSYDNVGAELAYRGQSHVGSAQTCQKAGKDHADVTDPEYVDSKSLTGLRMLTDSTQPHAEAGLVEDKPDHQDK